MGCNHSGGINCAQSSNQGKLCDAVRKEDPLTKSPWVEVQVGVTVVMSIVSMALAIDSFVQLNGVSSSVVQLSGNWEALPILNVQTVSYGTFCPSGYQTLDFSKARFPGLVNGSCACAVNATVTGVLSTPGNCTASALASPFCTNDPAVSPKPLDIWRYYIPNMHCCGMFQLMLNYPNFSSPPHFVVGQCQTTTDLLPDRGQTRRKNCRSPDSSFRSVPLRLPSLWERDIQSWGSHLFPSSIFVSAHPYSNCA